VVIRADVGLLELAEQQSFVSRACKVPGYSLARQLPPVS
jgi:hypothetical protein